MSDGRFANQPGYFNLKTRPDYGLIKFETVGVSGGSLIGFKKFVSKFQLRAG
jgi:hypothetical protein